MTLQDDVEAARTALRALEGGAAAVASHYPNSVDARRLLSDVARVAEDLHPARRARPPCKSAGPTRDHR